MREPSQQDRDDGSGQTRRPDPTGSDSVGWHDISAADRRMSGIADSVDESREVGDTGASGAPWEWSGATEQILEGAPIGVVLLTAEGQITHANARAEELLGLSRADMEGVGYDNPDWDIWDEAGDPIPREEHPVTQVLATGEPVQGFTHGITLPDGSERWLSSNVAPVDAADDSVEQIVVALEDITAFKRLEGLVDTFQAVEEVLNSAPEREETEQTICELLTETRAYQYARISEHTPGTASTDRSLQGHSRNVSSGESVQFPIHSPAEREPARAAVETGEIQVLTRDQSDSPFAQWRADTLDQGFQGGAVVPLAHRNRVYGLLVLYTERPAAFPEREQMMLATLGDRIGQVLHTLETERVLHADDVAELTFQSTDPESFFVSASGKLGCTIDIKDTIPTSDATLVYYASVRGASPAALREVSEDAGSHVELRQIRERADPPGGEVEVELRGHALAEPLVEMGAVVTAATVNHGRAEIVCEVPLGHDITSLVRRLTDSFPETRLVAKREYDRSATSSGESACQVLGETFREDLTDRQQQVLRAAMHSGYFESPRASTATEIADTLSLTQSTFAYHLRNAQQTLFEQLFDRLQR